MGGLGPEALWTLSAVGLVVPVLAVAATSFARVLVVLGLLRGGLGLPDALPGPVLGALASVLTAVLMWPTALAFVPLCWLLGGFTMHAVTVASIAFYMITTLPHHLLGLELPPADMAPATRR